MIMENVPSYDNLIAGIAAAYTAIALGQHCSYILKQFQAADLLVSLSSKRDSIPFRKSSWAAKTE